MRIGTLYAPFRGGLLAEADRALLQAGQADAVAQRALARVFGFVGMVGAAQLRDDPFLLLTDFLAGLKLPASSLQPDEGMLSLRADGTTWVMLAGTATRSALRAGLSAAHRRAAGRRPGGGGGGASGAAGAAAGRGVLCRYRSRAGAG